MPYLTRIFLLIAAFLLSTPIAFAQGREPLCRTISHRGGEFAVCTVDLRQHQVRLFWRGADGQAFGSFGRLLDAPEGARLVFAMNAGMYDEALAPVGLYVEGGQEMKRANTAAGPGNFHMKPNGIFYVRGQQAGVMETGRYVRQKVRVDFATQSGPMLVIDGKIHPRISEQGTSRKIRNGVGVRGRNVAVFAISSQPVTFHEFATLFRDELGCPNALFLDGSISSLYSPELNRRDGLLPLGPIVGALPRH